MQEDGWIDESRQTFITESQDLLVEMENALSVMSEGEDDEELLNAVFRAAHTIKGSSGLFGFDHIVNFTHQLETFLDKMRNKEITVTPHLVQLLLSCRDHLEALVEEVAEGVTKTTLEDAGNTLLEGLALFDPETKKQADNDDNDKGKLLNERVENSASVTRSDSQVETDDWLIYLKFSENVLRNGMDPLSFLRYLQTIGTLVNVTTILHNIPDAEHIDVESCYLSFQISFHGDVEKQMVENAFEFVEDDCDVHIIAPHSKLKHYVALIDNLSEDKELRLGEILLEVGLLTEKELQHALILQERSKQEHLDTKDEEEHGSVLPIGEILIEERIVPEETVNSALKKQQILKEKKVQENRSIRIDAGRLDDLINLVGELVIAGAGSSMLAQQINNEALIESTSVVSRLIEEIRDTALHLRMVPIGETFRRFHRVVREVTQNMDKSVELLIEGADTELDKTVAEKIVDPLTHMIRNSLDHGIEETPARKKAEKRETGQIILNAFYDSGSIIIEVSDDGRGVDKEKVLAKAIQNGLVNSGQDLTDKEILRLILEPGLSTAAKVSDLSGRGVGMDVVKRNLESLRGSVEIESTLGEGTCIRMRLPLTLSIIDGFLLGVGNATYVVPLDSVVECIEYTDTSVDRSNAHYINLRGEVLPFICLREFFAEEGGISQRENIIVVQGGEQKIGLVVDRLLGEFQTVIKPLSSIFSRLSGISGSTILGSGEVAMILDVAALVEQAGKVVQKEKPLYLH